LLLKIMGSRVVLKIMSMPIVMKIVTMEMKAIMWVMSLFSRKKKETLTEQGQPPESGSPPPTRWKMGIQNIALNGLSRMR
jgi:hypothetical protein